MGEVFMFIFLLLLLLLFTVGYYMLGSRANRKIDAKIAEAEKKYKNLPLIAFKRVDEAYLQSIGCEHYTTELVMTGVTLGIDNTRTWLSSIKLLLGGQVGYFSDLQVRGREFSAVRLQGEADKLGAVAVYNVKFETSNIVGQNTAVTGRVSVEFLAYGTAIIPAKNS